MELVRWGQAFKIQSHDAAYHIENVEPSSQKVQINFRGFGRGYERTSEFAVNLRWADVEMALGAFSKMGHPEAIKLRNALSLAQAAEDAGWKGDPTPSS